MIDEHGEPISPKFASTGNPSSKCESKLELIDESMVERKEIYYSDANMPDAYIPAAGVGVFN